MVDVKDNRVTEVIEYQTDAVLKTIEIDEQTIDFGTCVGTASSDGELDIKNFIDVAMELPTLRKKYGGRKMTLN